VTTAEIGPRADARPDGWTCLCHFPSGEEGVYLVEHERLLRGTRTSIAGVEGLWTVTEMTAPDEAEVIDAEIWVRPAETTTGDPQ
jgi:hypothetical protein